MARLSGRASEHHYEGPGDAPRRKKGRPSQTPSVDVTSIAKRAASPSGEASQTKRTKRVQLDDHEQLERELEESIAQSQNTDTTQATTKKTSRHNRRHSEPVVSAQDDNDTEFTFPTPPATQPLTGLTPHLQRVGAPRGRPTKEARRARMSMPAQLRIEPVDETDGNRQVQFAPLSAVLDNRTRRRLRRSHLSQEVNEIEEHQKEDKKLRRAFTDLRRQLTEKDNTIRDLQFQLEARRLGDIDMTDDHAEELEQALEQAKKEIEELRASSLYTGSSREQSAFDGGADDFDDDDDDDEPLMLIEPNEIGVSQEQMEVEPIPNGKYAARALEMSSQVTMESLSQISMTNRDSLLESTPVPDKVSDQIVKRYENEIEQLIKHLGDAQGALRIVAIELQNLNVIDPGASSNDILASLRDGFDTLRVEIDKLFPNTTTGLTNSELLYKIPELFEDILEELREKTVLVETHRKSEKTLRTQYESVLDVLAGSEKRNEDLDQKIYSLDKGNEQKQREILDLEQHVASLTNLRDEQDKDIQDKTVQIHSLNDELGDKDTDLQRLRDSLKQYRTDLDAVTKTATRVEEELHETITRMEQEHADVVEDLNTQLGAEETAREAAEGDAQQKAEYIEELEGRIERLETDVDFVTDELAQLKERLAAETEARQAAEAERDEQVENVYSRDNTIENLNDTIADLENDIAQFRENLESERTQRERTKASLDEANDRIDELDTRIHDAGIQTNELRSKLFQVQQEKEEAVALLRDEAQDRENEVQELLDTESQRRKDAEQEVANLEKQVELLENNILNLETDVEQMTVNRDDLEKDRDEQVADLNANLADLDQKYKALENNTSSTITTLRANITDLNNEVAQQKAEIERLSEEAEENERSFQEELASKDNEIAGLENDLATSRHQNEKLVKENASLAERVEAEASELLNIMGSHAEESNALRETINSQERTIKVLQDTAAKRAAEHDERVAELTSEIEDLRTIGHAHTQHIVDLEGQIEDLKERFRAQEEDTRTTIDTLTESQRRLQDQNEQLAAALKKRNADALKAVQEMKVKGIEVKTQGFDLHKVSNGKVTKVTEKVKVGKKGAKKKSTKRQWDSGFGVDENIEADIDELVPDEAFAA